MIVPRAPRKCLTFSHAHNSWLASPMGYWIEVSGYEARELAGLGYRVLDAV